jgi:hypothetical protein
MPNQDQDLAKTFRSLEYKDKEAVKEREAQHLYACTHIDTVKSHNAYPTCRYSGTFCPHSFEPELVEKCPTKLFYDPFIK